MQINMQLQLYDNAKSECEYIKFKQWTNFKRYADKDRKAVRNLSVTIQTITISGLIALTTHTYTRKVSIWTYS